MLGKLTRIALLGALVLLVSTVFAASAYAETTAYGNVNFNAIYNLTNSPNGNGDIGLDGTPAPKDTASGAGTFTLNAFASKFGVKGSNDTDMGKVTAVIEVDADGRPGTSAVGGDSSAPAIRLRHAYGTVGNLLLGRTWGGVITDFSWFPASLDPEGTYGSTAVFGDPRMAQVRYTVPLGDNKFVISAEANSGIRSAIAGDVASMPPRLVPAFYMNLGMAKVQVLAAMTTYRVAYTDANGKPADETFGGTAFGVNAAVAAGDAGTVKFHFFTGGAGQQVNAITILGGGAYYSDTGSTATKPKHVANAGTDMTLSYSHKLGDGASVNATYGSVALADYKKAGTAPSGNSIHLNYQWAAAPGVGMGVEYATKTISYKKDAASAVVAKDEDASNSAIIYSANFGF